MVKGPARNEPRADQKLVLLGNDNESAMKRVPSNIQLHVNRSARGGRGPFDPTGQVMLIFATFHAMHSDTALIERLAAQQKLVFLQFSEPCRTNLELTDGLVWWSLG